MSRIGFIPGIIEIKDHLDRFKDLGVLESWELPYENLLTRRSAAIFFLMPVKDSDLSDLWDALSSYEHFSYRLNTEKSLSRLDYRVTFSEDEYRKNEEALSPVSDQDEQL